MAKNREAAIRQVVAQHAATWNRHDMTAYAALFTTDGDLVNIRGGWWHGRALIEEGMTALHQTMFRASHLVPSEISVRFLTGNVALAHIPLGTDWPGRPRWAARVAALPYPA